MMCAADRASGIACKGRCEAAVDATDALVRRNVAIGSKVSPAHWVQFAAYAVFGLVSAGMAIVLIAAGGRELPLIALFIAGAMFMGMCAFNVLRWMTSVRPARG